MKKQLKKAIQTDLVQLISSRLTSIDAMASEKIQKIIISASKEISGKFIKKMNFKMEEPPAKDVSSGKTPRAKKVAKKPIGSAVKKAAPKKKIKQVPSATPKKKATSRKK